MQRKLGLLSVVEAYKVLLDGKLFMRLAHLLDQRVGMLMLWICETDKPRRSKVREGDGTVDQFWLR
jgi:hypothetical protein